MKKIYSFLVSLMIASFAIAQEIQPLPCAVTPLCSSHEKTVWATDGSKCFVFRNDCLLLIENCQRQNNYVPELRIVPKAECQALCEPNCTMDLKPVCGEYNGQTRTFPNHCSLDSHNCQTGETYLPYGDGNCDE